MGSDFGALSSLGIASGVLKYDVIDKLKNADKDIMIKPLEVKLDLVKKKEKALNEFITIASTVKSDISSIADGTAFAKVNTNVSGSSVSVSANDGVKPQEFDINVKELAKNDIYESIGFSSIDDQITDKDVTLKIGVGDNSVSFDLKSGATLTDLKDAINNANAGITASIIDTGIGDNPYKLILKANDTGKDNIIKFDYGSITDLGLNATTYTSAKYSSDSDKVNDSGDTQTFKITINGTEYSMDVDDGTTVSDFVDAINNGELKNSDGNSLEGISASYNSDTGKIEFHLQQVGDITIDDTNLTTNFNDNTDFTNSNRIQTAANSKFEYNGVEVERSSNKIEDLIAGVTINLTSEGSSHVSIKNDIDSIVKDLQKFVADYNSMVSNINNLTAFDKDTGNVGLFQGDSTFTRIEGMFSSDLFGTMLSYETTKSDFNGNSYQAKGFMSLADLGFSMNRTGMISFDESKFREAYNSHPDLVEHLATMAFTKVNEDFKRLATDNHSALNILNQELKNEEKNYQKRIKSMNEFLNAKYEVMAKQFAMYDETISKFDAMSQALTMTIQQAINSKG